MRIFFICSDCNISFIQDELSCYINSQSVSELCILTDRRIISADISEHPKSKIYLIQDELRVDSNVRLGALLRTAVLALCEFMQNWRIYTRPSTIWSMFSELKNEIRKVEFIMNKLQLNGAVCISNWASNDALVLSILASEKKGLFLMTKLHGYDLYEEFAPKGRIPFRWFLVKQIQHFVAISEDGRNYFTKKYPKLADRTAMFHLGTKDRNIAIQPAPEGIMRVVTCGSATPNKRHMEVFEVLNQMDGVEWYHIGAGDLFEELQEKVKNEARIPVKLLGHLSQDEIYKLYATTAFTCFLSLSITEGLPVSMMEAISCGIPIISTDVGGCREIVVPETGFLLSANYTETEVMARIRDCANGPLAGRQGRKGIYDFWKENFEADKNYGKFLDYLEQFVQK